MIFDKIKNALGLGKSASSRRLEEAASKIELACSNNYKDMAKDAFREYQVLLDQELREGDLGSKEIEEFKQLSQHYEQLFQSYNHRQTAHWDQ